MNSLNVSIQLFSLASRETDTKTTTEKNLIVSIQLFSLASRENLEVFSFITGSVSFHSIIFSSE